MPPIRNVARGVQAFTSNVFLVEGDRTVLVDAGANFDVVSRLDAEFDLDAAALDAVVLTHTHFDHVQNVEALREAADVETWGFDAANPAVDNPIDDGAAVRLGDHEYVALHTPGHKDDHLCFHAAGPGVLFAGDLVFANGGFGRTDLDEGDREALVRSVDRVRTTVTEDLREMHTGHGPSVLERPYDDIELAGRAARMR